MTPSALIALIQDAANSAAQTPAAGAAPSTGTAPITDPPAAGGGWTQSLMSFLPMIAIFAIFYFVLIGPERKNRKRREEMLKKLEKGDKVLTTGGMFATVAAIQEDNSVTLLLDEGVRVRFSRASIQEVLSDTPAVSSKK